MEINMLTIPGPGSLPWCHVKEELERYVKPLDEHTINRVLKDFTYLRRDVREYNLLEQIVLDDGSYNGKTEVKLIWVRKVNHGT